MGEAKRRKNLGIPPREKSEDIKLPQLDKKVINLIFQLWKNHLVYETFWDC